MILLRNRPEQNCDRLDSRPPSRRAAALDYILPRLETTPLLSGERDWQAAVLRVVPVREECHAATRMLTSQIPTCHRPHANYMTVLLHKNIGLEYKYITGGLLSRLT